MVIPVSHSVIHSSIRQSLVVIPSSHSFSDAFIVSTVRALSHLSRHPVIESFSHPSARHAVHPSINPWKHPVIESFSHPSACGCAHPSVSQALAPPPAHPSSACMQTCICATPSFQDMGALHTIACQCTPLHARHPSPSIHQPADPIALCSIHSTVSARALCCATRA